MAGALPLTYCDIARFLMAKMVEQANRIDFVSDTYQHPPIKDVEREKRGECACEAVIQGLEQRRLKKFRDALSNESFEWNFLLFLANEWSKHEYEYA